MPDFSASDDELLSSYLDNEVTAEERALVETRAADDPDFAERLEALRHASTFAATPVTPLSPGQTTDLIAAALAASTSTAPNVTDLAAASATRKPARWKGALVSAAAAVAALAIAVPVVQNLGDSDADDSGFAADTDAGEGNDNFAADQMQESVDEGENATDDMADDDMADGDMASEAATVDDMADDPTADLDDESPGDGLAGGDDGGADVELDEPSIAELSEMAQVLQALLDAPDATVAFYTPPTDFDSTDEALDQAVERWEDRSGEDQPALTTTTVAGVPVGTDLENLDLLARARVDAFGGCETLVDVLLEQPFEASVVAIELASTVIDGTPATTVIVDLATGEAAILIVVHDECVIELEALVDRP